MLLNLSYEMNEAKVYIVIPAKAGILIKKTLAKIPAFARMTRYNNIKQFLYFVIQTTYLFDARPDSE